MATIAQLRSDLGLDEGNASDVDNGGGAAGLIGAETVASTETTTDAKIKGKAGAKAKAPAKAKGAKVEAAAKAKSAKAKATAKAGAKANAGAKAATKSQAAKRPATAIEEPPRKRPASAKDKEATESEDEGEEGGEEETPKVNDAVEGDDDDDTCNAGQTRDRLKARKFSQIFDSLPDNIQTEYTEAIRWEHMLFHLLRRCIARPMCNILSTVSRDTQVFLGIEIERWQLEDESDGHHQLLYQAAPYGQACRER